ncbi:MAG TPA: sulfotransferase, partial [Novosphingobium sp.]|nr:sulfotransferase [Novosphingobium sp.]
MGHSLLARLDHYLDAAATACGHTDFAEDFAGASLREGLARFLADLDAEDRLSAQGLAATEAQIGLMLRSRLETVAAWKAHPAYRAVDIRRPLIITGIVRSGTTALHRLLTVDPQFLGVPHWLVRSPRPLPPRAGWAADPQFQAASAVLERMIAQAPEMLNDHMMTAEAVEESIFLLAPTFCNNMYPSQWTVPAYDAWYRAADEVPAYRWLADCLRLIGLEAPGRPWLMKNPTDLHAIDALFTVFPDARIIHTHRDPVQAIPSITHLLLSVRRMFEGARADPAQVLRREGAFWAQALARAESARQQQPDRFVDISFAAFVKDQMAAVEQIYAQLELELAGPVADAMRAWLAAHPRRPGHIQRHRAEDFGVATGWLEEI